ncbi:MAG: hypothetical protein VBE63_15605 [Lamprobacter sp.]|nr:hypothetical protein [Lamprobacter sp.]MEA3641349.1 hypothetical protein [Lamprobacter sp.]
MICAFQFDLQRLLRAAGGTVERRQSIALESTTVHAHARAALLTVHVAT